MLLIRYATAALLTSSAFCSNQGIDDTPLKQISSSHLPLSLTQTTETQPAEENLKRLNINDGSTSLPEQQETNEFTICDYRIPLEIMEEIMLKARIKDGIVLGLTCRHLNELINSSSRIWLNYVQRIPGAEQHYLIHKNPGEVHAAYLRRFVLCCQDILKNLMIPLLIPLHSIDASYGVAVSGNGLTLVGTTTLLTQAEGEATKRSSYACALTRSGPSDWEPHLFKGTQEDMNTYARSIDYDGSFIVGIEQNPNNEESKALIWKRGNTEGRRLKGILNDEHEEMSYANGVITFQGKTVIVGNINHNSFLKAAKWTIEEDNENVQILGTLNNGESSRANAISLDATTIVGFSLDGTDNNNPKAFIWTEKEGMRSLGTLKGDSASEAVSVNAYGNMIVGNSYKGEFKDSTSRVFLWIKLPEQDAHQSINHPEITFSAGGIMMPLASLGKNSVAQAISRDSQYIIGSILQNTDTSIAFRVSTRNSSESLLLNSESQELSLEEAFSISHDGTIILLKGTTLTPQGSRRTVFYNYMPQSNAFEAQGINLLKLK